MLRVGLTGGIGSGKSTAARRFTELGAVLVDSDVLAREVVAVGTPGLAEIVADFGDGVLGPDGALDRPALAAVVFGDPAARARLNAIVHPRVREGTEQVIAAARGDAIVVQDIPLLVETRSPAEFDLVVVVQADAATRVRRLVDARGMSAVDARARIDAQAGDEVRRAAADVLLDNDGAPAALAAAVDALWHRRLVPFEQNLRLRRPALPADGVTEPESGWAAAGARLAARVARAAGAAGGGAAHVGPTAVPGAPVAAADPVEILLGVSGDDGVEVAGDALDGAGFPRLPADQAGAHGGVDPGRPVLVHVRPVGSPQWRSALLRRDWLRADPTLRPAADAPSRPRDDITRAEEWAASSGWTPSLE